MISAKGKAYNINKVIVGKLQDKSGNTKRGSILLTYNITEVSEAYSHNNIQGSCLYRDAFACVG